MKQPLKRSLAIFLTLCSLLTLLVPAVSAAILEPETIVDAVIYDNFSLSQYYVISKVDGHNYLYAPYLSCLFVFDLDTWEMVDTQYFDSDKTRIGSFVDSKGYVWTFSSGADFYRYDPVSKTMLTYTVPSTDMGFSKLYSPVEVDGKLYFGTYGPASTGGAMIVEFNPNTIEWTSLGKLDPDAMYCSALTYHNGYFYATAQMNKAAKQPQYIVKFDPATQQVVDKLDIYNDGVKPYYSTVSYFDDIRVAGDTLFVGGNSQSKMLAIDIGGDKMKFAEDLKNMPECGIQRCISEEVDGKIYFCGLDHREKETTGVWRALNHLYSYDIATKTFTQLTSEPNYGDIRSPESMVTLVNQEFGLNGKYILTMDMQPAPRIVLYGLDGSRHEMPEMSSVKVPNRLTSLELGPDGKTVYTGAYMNNTTGVVDLTTGAVKTLPTFSNQLSRNHLYNGKWYVTNYGACSLSVIGEDDTVTTLYALNEGANKEYFKQERMWASAAGDNKVFTATVPHKGLVGGYLVWYDYDKKATYVAVENDLVIYAKDGAQETWYDAKTDALYTFTGTKFEGLVKNQIIKTMCYQDGYIYACTSAWGGSQSFPVEGETAKLIVYDPVKLEMVATYDIRDGIKDLNPNIEAITGMDADPDVPGKFWGLVSGTLFSFTFDKDTKTFNVQEAFSYGKDNYMGSSASTYAPWAHCFRDGYLFYYNVHGSTAKTLMMVSTEDPSYRVSIPVAVGHRWVLGYDNNVYFTTDARIQKYNIADLIADGKAGKADADKEAAAALQAQIDAIGTVTLESEEAIKAARAAYDAMSDTRKALVNADALIAAEAALADLQAPAVSSVLYIVIAVVAAAAIAAVAIVLVRRKKKA